MQILKVGTAATRTFGPVLDSAGAAYNSMAIADFSISKNGTMAAMATDAVTSKGNGMYTIVLSTGDTDTLGDLVISCNKATYGMQIRAFTVLSAATFDAIVTNAAGAAGGLLIAGSNAATTFSTLTVTGAVALQSTLTVTGTTTLAAVTQVGSVSLGATAVASLAVTGALSVGTTTTLTGNVTLGGTLGTGAVTFASVAVTGALSVGTTTTLTGAVSLGSTLGITGIITATAANSITIGGVAIDGKSVEAALKIIAATASGIISGAGSGTETFLGLDKSTPRATVTVDGSGNRSAITYG